LKAKTAVIVLFLLPHDGIDYSFVEELLRKLCWRNTR